MSQDSDSNNYLKVQCHVCETKIDMSDLDPFTQINCPSCEELITVPKILDHYLLEEELGRNCRYVTYKAADLRLHRTVVIKLLNPEFRDNPETVKKFFKHAGRIALLNHPSLTPVYSSGEKDDEAFVVSQYLDFNSLESYFELKEKKIKLYKSCYILRSVAKALHSTWKYDLGHFNLNLRNIVFDNDGHINVSDVGFSKLLFDEAEDKELVSYFSPEYIAPEVVESQKFSELSDIYSFGIIAYQLFTGSLPFVHLKPHEQMNLRLEREIVAPNLINKNLPEELSDFCLALCEKDPERRIQNFEKVGQKINHLMATLFDSEELSSSSDNVTVNSAATLDVKKEEATSVDQSTPTETVHMPDIFEASAKEDKDYKAAKKIAMALYYIIALFVMPPVFIALVCWLSLTYAPDSLLSQRVREVFDMEKTVSEGEPVITEESTEASENSNTEEAKTTEEASKEVKDPKTVEQKTDEAQSKLVYRPKPKGLNFFKAREELSNYYEKLPDSVREKVKTQVLHLLKSRKVFIEQLNGKDFSTEVTIEKKKHLVTLRSVNSRTFKFDGESGEMELSWKNLEVSDLKRFLTDSLKVSEATLSSLDEKAQEALNEKLDKTKLYLALLIHWYELDGFDELRASIKTKEIQEELAGLL